MPHWNYRVLRKEADEGSALYHIHEVYYNDEGQIEGWTAEPVLPSGEAIDELREDVRFFLRAFQKPVLEVQDVDGKAALVPGEVDVEINPGHYVEVMDRAWVALSHFYDFVGCHPVMRKEKRLRELYERAEEAMYAVYQEAGRLEYDQAGG